MNLTHTILAWTAAGALAFFTIGGLRGQRWTPGQWVAFGVACGPFMWCLIAISTAHFWLQQRRARKKTERASALSETPELPQQSLRTCMIYHAEQADHHQSMGGKMAKIQEARHRQWAKTIEALLR